MSRSYSDQHPYSYSTRGGWDIDTSDRTQRTCDGGHIPGREQFEETVSVSDDDDNDNDKNGDDE